MSAERPLDCIEDFSRVVTKSFDVGITETDDRQLGLEIFHALSWVPPYCIQLKKGLKVIGLYNCNASS